jgi:hypothetical protein
MISARSMWSYLLLSVYSLILLHDFIPHSHHDKQTGKKVYAVIEYIQHSLSHTDCESRSHENAPFSQENVDFDHLVDHEQELLGHHHELSYRVVDENNKSIQTVSCFQAPRSLFDEIEIFLFGIEHSDLVFFPDNKQFGYTKLLRAPPFQA